MRTVTELERAGISALTIEDTLLPAKFGHKSTDLIEIPEAVGKIRARWRRGSTTRWRSSPVPMPGCSTPTN